MTIPISVLASRTPALAAYECFAADGMVEVGVRGCGGHPEHAGDELALLLTDGKAVVEIS